MAINLIITFLFSFLIHQVVYTVNESTESVFIFNSNIGAKAITWINSLGLINMKIKISIKSDTIIGKKSCV